MVIIEKLYIPAYGNRINFIRRPVLFFHLLLSHQKDTISSTIHLPVLLVNYNTFLLQKNIVQREKYRICAWLSAFLYMYMYARCIHTHTYMHSSFYYSCILLIDQTGIPLFFSKLPKHNNFWKEFTSMTKNAVGESCNTHRQAVCIQTSS